MRQELIWWLTEIGHPDAYLTGISPTKKKTHRIVLSSTVPVTSAIQKINDQVNETLKNLVMEWFSLWKLCLKKFSRPMIQWTNGLVCYPMRWPNSMVIATKNDQMVQTLILGWGHFHHKWLNQWSQLLILAPSQPKWVILGEYAGGTRGRQSLSKELASSEYREWLKMVSRNSTYYLKGRDGWHHRASSILTSKSRGCWAKSLPNCIFEGEGNKKSIVEGFFHDWIEK